MKKILLFLPYLTAAAVITVIILLIYVAVQQNYRSGADDPQLQIARDINNRLHRGASIQKYMNDSINLESSQEVFTALYDSNAAPIKSSGFLNERVPQLPPGVFAFVKANGEERVTWQPKPGVRMATVVLRAALPSIAYIVVGRSLQEVEIREQNLRNSVFICWVISMALIAITAFTQKIIQIKQSPIA
ncbi:MAG: hypothetical protein JST75_14525 [Bacteroidetes bacterium]|nr:hypothetical protein [Bacteroidota bacterium]